MERAIRSLSVPRYYFLTRNTNRLTVKPPKCVICTVMSPGRVRSVLFCTGRTRSDPSPLVLNADLAIEQNIETKTTDQNIVADPAVEDVIAAVAQDHFVACPAINPNLDKVAG